VQNFGFIILMWLQILLTVTVKITSFWNVASNRYYYFGETCSVHYQGSLLILDKHTDNLGDVGCVLGCDSSRWFKATPKCWYRCEITLCRFAADNSFGLHTFILGVPDGIMCTFLGHFPHYPTSPKVCLFFLVTWGNISI
jgi:hypothetical protein